MKSGPLIGKLSIYALLVLIAFVIADLSTLIFRGQMFPTAPAPARPPVRVAQNQGQSGNYGSIVGRNIFNSDRKIPPAVGAAGGTAQPDAPPVPSQLPLALIGTIVHVNPERSVATLNLKSKNDQVAVRVNDQIPETPATVLEITRTKIVFRNTASQRKEYIEMKDDGKISFGAAAFKPTQHGEVTKMGENDFQLKRDDINRLTSNLPELLQQARAVPRMGPNGQIECFSMADIAPGSIYERLGLKRGDCIKSVNGERIDSPAKAMELYNALRANANAINLGIERGGRDENFNYNITQ